MTDNQVIYFANNDGTIDRVTIHSMKRLHWRSRHQNGKANTKIFVLAKHIVDEYQIQHLITNSLDTDAFVVACYQFKSSLITLDKLWLKTGTRDKKRYVAIHEMANHFRRSMLKSLPAFHAITGCHSVSSFTRIGKKAALTTLISTLGNLMEILHFGDSPSLDLLEACVEAAIKFLCLLYGDKSKDTDINGLRYTSISKENLSDEKLPPAFDTITLHSRRAAYKYYI